MQHVVEESDTGPYPDVLGRRYLRCMVGVVLWGDGGIGRREGFVGEEIGIGKVVEWTAIEGERDLNFGLVSCTVDEGDAAIGHLFGDGVGRKIYASTESHNSDHI